MAELVVNNQNILIDASNGGDIAGDRGPRPMRRWCGRSGIFATKLKRRPALQPGRRIGFTGAPHTPLIFSANALPAARCFPIAAIPGRCGSQIMQPTVRLKPMKIRNLPRNWPSCATTASDTEAFLLAAQRHRAARVIHDKCNHSEETREFIGFDGKATGGSLASLRTPGIDQSDR
jgi:hypothetical protein